MSAGFSITSVRSKFSLSQNLMKKYRGCRHFSSRASDSFRAWWTIRFEQGEHLASGGASISLRAGRASRFGQGEHLASSGASNSLRTGRASRFGRGEQLASGRANGKTLFTGFSITSVRFKFCLCKTCVELFRGRGGVGGRAEN